MPAHALTFDDLVRNFRVEPGSRVRLKDHDPAWMGASELRSLGVDELKDRSRKYLERTNDELAEAQDLLWANATHGVLIVFQAMDAAGKDGTIKHVMSGVNPQGCAVCSFKKPSDEELRHSWLWRYMKATPERGQIVIFNRSHYEDVLVTRVHPELLHADTGRRQEPGKKFWKRRYEDINAFERHLVRDHTLVLKFFLNVSKREQKRRFMERLDNPEKHWKFSPSDVAERAHWTSYMEAYEDLFEHTSSEDSPWWIIPADHKFVTRALVAAVISASIRGLDLRPPRVGQEQMERLREARAQLERE